MGQGRRCLQTAAEYYKKAADFAKEAEGSLFRRIRPVIPKESGRLFRFDNTGGYNFL